MHQCTAHILRCAILSRSKSCGLKLFRNGGISLQTCRYIPLLWHQKLCRSTCSEVIGETDLLLEDGMDIQELPIIIRKVSEDHLPDVPKTTNRYKKRYRLKGSDIKEMFHGFENCDTMISVFALLDIIPPSEITPSVALQALKKIIEFENSHDFLGGFDIPVDNEDADLLLKNNAVNNLIKIITTSDNSKDILGALELVTEDMAGDEVFFFRQILCNEVLSRIADDKFSILEICHSAHCLVNSGNQIEVDKLWVGVFERQNDINENNIMEVFRILPHTNLSRPFFLKILHKQLKPIALNLKEENIAEILTVLHEMKEYPFHIIQILLKWLTIKIYKINKDKLINVIKGFMLLPNMEKDVVTTIEKFISKEKLNVDNPKLIGAFMDYCNKYKVRSPVIFNFCGEYLLKNAKNMTPSTLKSIFLPLGNLNFCPTDDTDFWNILEEELLKKFVQLYSEDVLDIMLCFIFLEKYPIKFVTKIFNPFFLDRLHSLKGIEWMHSIRTKLKLLDTALMLECKLYKGPLLFPDMSSSLIKQDLRIQKISAHLLEILPLVLGPDQSMAPSVVLKNLPLTELYIVDIIVHPRGKLSLFDPNESWHEYTALLIHTPEHYDFSGQYLVGMQVMRRRHLRLVGLNVIDLNYNKINSLLCRKNELIGYLKNRLSIPEEVNHL